jgi:hypothetical protein
LAPAHLERAGQGLRLGAAVQQGRREALLAEGRPGLFTIAHFDKYPAVLMQLNAVTVETLREALVEAWLACAPPALAEGFLQSEG